MVVMFHKVVVSPSCVDTSQAPGTTCVAMGSFKRGSESEHCFLMTMSLDLLEQWLQKARLL